MGSETRMTKPTTNVTMPNPSTITRLRGRFIFELTPEKKRTDANSTIVST